LHTLCAVDELTKPELQHHQRPEPVGVVVDAVAVLAPDARDLAVVEHAASLETAVEQQLLHHPDERPAQPLTDRRRASLLRPMDDRTPNPSRTQAPEAILAA